LNIFGSIAGRCGDLRFAILHHLISRTLETR
jgi:hypothetical protein